MDHDGTEKNIQDLIRIGQVEDPLCLPIENVIGAIDEGDDAVSDGHLGHTATSWGLNVAQISNVSDTSGGGSVSHVGRIEMTCW